MALTLGMIQSLESIFCYPLSELQRAFPSPQANVKEERVDLEKRVAGIASSGGLSERELEGKLLDLQAGKTPAHDQETVNALRELFGFPADVLEKILKKHTVPIAGIKAQKEALVEEMLINGTMMRDEILMYLDSLKANGVQKVYLYRVPTDAVRRMKAVPSMDVAVWNSTLPKLAGVFHPVDGRGEHFFKLVRTRSWEEKVETGPNQFAYVPRQERSLTFLRVDGVSRIAQLRIQLLKPRPEVQFSQELKWLGEELGNEMGFDSFEQLFLAPVVSRWLRRTPRELEIREWKVWTEDGGFIHKKGSPGFFQKFGRFFINNRPSFLLGSWIGDQGTKIPFHIDVEENSIEVRGKCRGDQFTKLLNRIADFSTAIPPDTGVDGDSPSPRPEGLLKWIRLVLKMALQKDGSGTGPPGTEVLKYRYALAGLGVGTLFMICGLALLLHGVLGNTQFMATILGAQTQLTDAPVGLVFAVLGVFVILITRFTTR